MSETFDYIVIGGGAAGCVVAGRLAERKAGRILLLEAGPRPEDHPETLSADGYKHAFVNDALFWDRFTVPQGSAGNQRFFVGTGRVLGGSAAVNGMVYTRGDRRDFDVWPPGWRFDDVRPDYEALEARLAPRPRPPTRWTEACIDAATARGLRRCDDLNAGDLGGVIGYEPMTYDGDRRRNSYVAFVAEPGPFEDLEIRTNARVHRLEFGGEDGRRAVAVHYERDGRVVRARVRGEVILAAGALETPKILMLSGVGAGQALRFVGIEPRVENEGVGRNLHDHPNVPLFFWSRHVVDCLYPQIYSFRRTYAAAPLPAGQPDTCFVFWPAPSAMKEAVQRMLPGKVLPPKLYHGPGKLLLRKAVGALFDTPPAARMVDHLYGIVVILGKPRSRGSVRLAGPSADTPAVIDPAYLSHPEDLATMVEGVRFARSLARAGTLESWTRAELLPGPLVRDDEAIARFVEKQAITTYHFAGTCSMGTSDAHPVTPRLRLRGTHNVRIADASAIPATPVSALQAPSMLVGYRAATYLLEDRP